jgi:hypothetical protein
MPELAHGPDDADGTSGTARRDDDVLAFAY